MNTITILAYAICYVGYCTFATDIPAQTGELGIGEVDSSQYVSNMTQTDNEEDVEIRDKEGNIVSNMEIFLDEGYQIEKPADRNICLMRRTNDSHICYVENALTEPLPEVVADHCSGREVVTLEPVECEEQTVDMESTETDLVRERRSTYGKCCKWTYTISRPCVCRYCCKRFWGKCIKRCCRSYGYRKIWTSRCVSGYNYIF